jgi:hypothetical protein
MGRVETNVQQAVTALRDPVIRHPVLLGFSPRLLGHISFRIVFRVALVRIALQMDPVFHAMLVLSAFLARLNLALFPFLAILPRIVLKVAMHVRSVLTVQKVAVSSSSVLEEHFLHRRD